jgi:hypothetical protein
VACGDGVLSVHLERVDGVLSATVDVPAGCDVRLVFGGSEHALAAGENRHILE